MAQAMTYFGLACGAAALVVCGAAVYRHLKDRRARRQSRPGYVTDLWRNR